MYKGRKTFWLSTSDLMKRRTEARFMGAKNCVALASKLIRQAPGDCWYVDLTYREMRLLQNMGASITEASR